LFRQRRRHSIDSHARSLSIVARRSDLAESPAASVSTAILARITGEPSNLVIGREERVVQAQTAQRAAHKTYNLPARSTGVAAHVAETLPSAERRNCRNYE
jgi:hypothetical protein